MRARRLLAVLSIVGLTGGACSDSYPPAGETAPAIELGASAAPSSSAVGSDAGGKGGAEGQAASVEAVQQLGWRGIQAPGPRNIRIVDASVPLGGSTRPPGPLVHVRISPDEHYTSGTTQYSRAELYGRVAPSWSDALSAWPDPPGSVRWFSFSIYLPPDFATATGEDQWLDLTQWKGRDGGSPPIAVEVQGDRLRLGGSRSNAGLLPDGGDLGRLAIGQWTSLVVGIHFAADHSGWVEAHRDGTEVVPRTEMSTMDVIDGAVDPVYLKQGIYRSLSWDQTQDVYFSTVSVSERPPG